MLNHRLRACQRISHHKGFEFGGHVHVIGLWARSCEETLLARSVKLAVACIEEKRRGPTVVTLIVWRSTAVDARDPTADWIAGVVLVFYAVARQHFGMICGKCTDQRSERNLDQFSTGGAIDVVKCISEIILSKSSPFM